MSLQAKTCGACYVSAKYIDICIPYPTSAMQKMGGRLLKLFWQPFICLSSMHIFCCNCCFASDWAKRMGPIKVTTKVRMVK